MKEEYDFSQGKRGAINPIPPGKTRVTTVLDDDILEWFRSQVHIAGGGNYQTLINDVLRAHIQCRQELFEAEEKNNKDLDEVLEALESITKANPRNSKTRGLRNIEVLTKSKMVWLFNVFVISMFAFLVATKLSIYFNYKPLAFLALIILLFITLFLILILYLTLVEVRNSSKVSQKDTVKNFMIKIEQEEVKEISKKFCVLALKKAEKYIELSLKRFQSRRKTYDIILQIVVFICVVFLILFFGEPVQQLLEGKLLYGTVTGIPGLIALLILIGKFISTQNEESITNKYNEWLFILEEAQAIDDEKQPNN